ncbi:DNA polymerase III subunit gamma/tau [Agromyces sp. NPDC058484]|uniref:DNA polymerase III subunit gamma/tau n=1 Tax=Agromyces sp. NPDC058484 TaxID=3346524 RepID=UPI00365C88C3
MPRDPDDDALRWDGDDDPTLAPGWKTVGNPAPLAGSDDEVTDAPAEASGGEAGAAASDTDVTGAAQTGSVELVVLGVLGGVYLLYTVGWLITALRTTAPGLGVVDDAMYALGLWLAVLAPALWLGLSFWLSARRRSRLLWLIGGAIVLVPVPFVLGVTA